VNPSIGHSQANRILKNKLFQDRTERKKKMMTDERNRSSITETIVAISYSEKISAASKTITVANSDSRKSMTGIAMPPPVSADNKNTSSRRLLATPWLKLAA
jgi:hypothetical protein